MTMEIQQATHQSYVNLIKTSREILVNQITNTQCLLDNLSKNEYFSTEDNEIVLQFRTRADRVRQILDLVESKGEEASEYFLSIIQRIPEAYFSLGAWLQRIDFHASEKVQNLPVINTDPVTRYSKKLKQELRSDSKIIMSYSQKEEMMLQESYVNGVMELLNASHETIGRVESLNSLFDDNGVINKDGETIFIFGDAGMGKSLLIQKMQNLWAREESYLDIKFLFRYRCRTFSFFKGNKQISLKDLLFKYNCNPDEYPEDVYDYILKFPESVLFTFDGFDEIHSNFDLSSIPEVSSPNNACHPVALLNHLLSGKLLKGSKKVLTGRTGCQVPGNIIQKKIMLRGFSAGNLLEYTNLFFKEPDIKRHVINHLDANHNFSSLCSIPLFCWIIFKSYAHFHSMNESHSFSSSSITLTDIFILIVEVYLNLSSKETNRSQAETYSCCRDTLLSVGRLAYNGMEESMFVFDQKAINSAKVSEKDLKLGFLRTVEDCGELGDIMSFEFFHVTLQSFFTALFLVIDNQSGTTDLLKFFSQFTQPTDIGHCQSLLSCVCSKKDAVWDPFKNTDHLQFINLFLCGLLSKPKQVLLRNLVSSSTLKLKRKALKQKLFQSVKSHLKSLPRSSFMGFNRVHALTHFLWMARCICETQNNEVGKIAAKGICADYIKLSFCGASSSDCGAISFVLNHFRKQLALELDNNNINDYGVKELTPCFSRLTVIRLSVNQITDEGARVLSVELTKYKIITFLGLYKNLITDFGAKYVARIIRECPNLKHLKLGLNKLTAVGGTCIAQAVQENSNIFDIGMWGNQIGDEGAQAFAVAIKNHPSLTELSLACNQISSKGGKYIAKALQQNTALQTLWMTENKLTDEAAESFAEMLMVNQTLRHLWLVNNCLTNNGANCLAKAIENNTTLEEICLHGNPLTLGENNYFEENKRIFHSLSCV
ncbi:nucleotide-binding oligomerization domain-containing protein 1 [Spea bombifrons]|uniref:nucleotide-binding oligomerization domain-containing protein 1 n=1 Tax=Spea bombifrons TaxID=233779 RepID=UPI0023495A82|nr:nucleotide-binding oligomerization domain-containing protein 1 [Spea bombifrons]